MSIRVPAVVRAESLISGPGLVAGVLGRAVGVRARARHGCRPLPAAYSVLQVDTVESVVRSIT